MEKAYLNKGYQSPKQKLGFRDNVFNVLLFIYLFIYLLILAALIISGKWVVTHVFLFRFQKKLLKSALLPYSQPLQTDICIRNQRPEVITRRFV